VFAIENLTPNGISWQHFFPLVLPILSLVEGSFVEGRLSKGEHPIAYGLFRQS
jgi:hypothetical protein